MIVYIAGPIDYTTDDPDERHRRLTLETMALGVDIHCPHCAFDPSEAPLVNIERNMAALHGADVLVVEWVAPHQPSFGTPVEMWEFVRRNSRAVVLGSLGSGLFAKQMFIEGVKEVATWSEVKAQLSLWATS